MYNSKTSLGLATVILLFVFYLFSLSFLGFFFQYTINSSYFYISIILCFISTYLLQKEFGISKSFKTLLFFLLLLILSIIITYFLYDYSGDGRTYHQAGIMLLNDGWNPVFENIEDFAKKIYGNNLYNYKWQQYYPKATEILYANILSVTNNIETGKAISFLSVIMVYCYALYVFSKDTFKKINKTLKILILTAIIMNPIVIGQIMTYYTDIHVYLYYLMLLFGIIDIETKHQINSHPWVIITLSSICLINVKLGGIFYVIVTYFIYYIYLCISKHKNKLKKLSLSLLIVLILGLISGYNPYITNLLNHKHPFYPLAGTGKIDIVTCQIPNQFKGKNKVFILLANTFSKVENVGTSSYTGKLDLKPPFLVFKSELVHIGGYDTRICGFGVFWSGIIILSFILALQIQNNNKQEKYLSFLILTLLILPFLANPYFWWARYVPHIWLLPLFIIIFANLKPSKIKFILTHCILFFIFLGALLQIARVSYCQYNYHKEFNKFYSHLKNKNQTIYIYEIKDWSLIRKFKEKNLDYKLVDENFYNSNKLKFEEVMFKHLSVRIGYE